MSGLLLYFLDDLKMTRSGIREILCLNLVKFSKKITILRKISVENKEI